MQPYCRIIMVLLCFSGFFPYPLPSAAAEPMRQMPMEGMFSNNAESIQVPLNKSRILELNTAARKISIGNKTIADIVVLQTRQVQIFGLELGTTNVLFWDKKGGIIRSVNVEVTHDLDGLKQKLYELLPREAIQVYSSQNSIVLKGEVSSLAKMDVALALAKTFLSGKGKNKEVLNLMQIGGAQQVMLQVQVAEISRSLTKRIGMKFNIFRPGGSWSIGAVTGGAVLAPSTNIPLFDSVPYGPGIPAFLPNALGIEDQGLFATFLDNNILFNVVLDLAKETGLAKILAEPTLTTLTGQEANFLAGGEFPIPVPGGGGNDRITVDYKEYGVGLRFVPIVLDSGNINLKVNVTVSDIANANSVSVDVSGAGSAFFIPSLTKRSANATVSLASGETIGIAGLINESLRENVDKVPGLGDIPVVGNLFKSQEFVKGQTELVIFVTPHLAKPIQASQVKLPTDVFVEPNDIDFYLFGRMEGEHPPRREEMIDKSGAEGRFGHDL